MTNDSATGAGLAPEPSAAPAPASSGSAGALLRQAREGRGVALEDLAQSLKVPPDKLQALERDDWQVLPDLVFARTLALRVCRHLQVETAPIMALLPQAAMARLESKGNLNEPVRHRSVPSALAGNGAGLGRKLLGGVLGLAVLAGLLYVGAAWLQQRADYAQAEEAATASETLLAEPALLFAPSDEGQEVAELPQSAPTALVAQSAWPEAATADTPAAQELSQPQSSPLAPGLAEAAGVAEAATQAATAGPTAATDSPVLRLRATAQTWVQVRGAGQQVLLEKILQPDEVYESRAQRPLTVVIGQAQVTEVQVDGQAFDLAAVTRGNVARFEVK